MNTKIILGVLGGIVLGFILAFFGPMMAFVGESSDQPQGVSFEEHKSSIEQLVYDHARAWETGDVELLQSTMHEDIVFAYPGRRLNFDQVVEDLQGFHETFTDTKVYINNVIVDGDMVAVEWQFASTEKESGKRTVVSDGIIGRIQEGKIIEWKEYLDGRVSRMQKVDALPLEEGETPFPSPEGSLRNYCELAC